MRCCRGIRVPITGRGKDVEETGTEAGFPFIGSVVVGYVFVTSQA